MPRILARGARVAPSYLLGRAAIARRASPPIVVGETALVAPGAVSAPGVLARAQAGGAVAHGFTDRTFVLAAPSAVTAPLALTRTQAGGAVAHGFTDRTFVLAAPSAVTAPLALTRTQAGGAVSTGDD